MLLLPSDEFFERADEISDEAYLKNIESIEMIRDGPEETYNYYADNPESIRYDV